MISLLYEPLPEHIRADGKDLAVLTDFRDWLKFIDLVNDRTLDDRIKVAMLPEWLHDRVPATKEIVEGLRRFCLARELEPDTVADAPEEDAAPRPPTWDWNVDAMYVLGDFRRYYGIDLLHVDTLHWWEFKALFAALPPDSRSMERIGIRAMDLSKIQNKAQKRRYAEMQRRIALLFRMDEDAIGAVFANIM